MEVGHEDDVGGFEALDARGVLAGEDAAVLEVFGEREEALACVFLCAREVKDDDRLVVVDEGCVVLLAG